MCEVPRRTWRAALRPQRVLLTCAALAVAVAGIWIGDLMGLALTGVAAALLLSAVALPTVREVEFGLPVGVKVKTAVREREEQLRRAFEDQRGELELCAQLVTDDPAVASRLLEAAWSKTAENWRGPPAPGLRLHVLCQLVRLLAAQRRWADPPSASPAGATPLAALEESERVAVVLHDFAGLSPALIAAVTGRSVGQVDEDLRSGAAKADAGRGGVP